MRYPYYRYQFGGASSDESKGVESITTQQTEDYEQKDWHQGWIIQSDVLPPPAGDKASFIKKRILKIQKKREEEQKKKQESLTSISGVKAKSSKESKGLMSIGREAILQGRKTVDSITRFSGRLRDSVFGRNRGSRGFKGFRGTKHTYGNYPTGKPFSGESQSSTFITKRINSKTKKKYNYSTPIKGEDTGCGKDKDCENPKLHCRVDPNTPKGTKSGTCKRRTCKIYSNGKKCGSHHICLPKNPEENYIPLEDDESYAGSTKDLSKYDQKLSDNIQQSYKQISAIRVRMLRFETLLFKGDSMKNFIRELEEISITTDGENKFKEKNQEQIQKLEKDIKDLSNKLPTLDEEKEFNYADVYFMIDNMKEIALQNLQTKVRGESGNLDKTKKIRDESRNEYESTINILNVIQNLVVVHIESEENSPTNPLVEINNIYFNGKNAQEKIFKKVYATYVREYEKIANKNINPQVFKHSLRELTLKNKKKKTSRNRPLNIEQSNKAYFNVRKKIENLVVYRNRLNQEDIHTYLSQKRELLRKAQTPQDSELIQHIDSINKLYTDKEREIFKPQKILKSYQENLTLDKNRNSFFRNLKINAIYHNYDKAYIGKDEDGKSVSDDLSKRKYQNNSYIEGRGKSQTLDNNPFSFANSIRLNNLIDDAASATFGALLSGTKNIPFLEPLMLIFAGIASGVYLIARSIGIAWSIFIGIMSLIFTPYRFARIFKYLTGYGRRVDKHCEKLYFLSYIKHNNGEREEINNLVKDTIEILKKKTVDYSFHNYNQRPIKRSRLNSIKKNPGKDGYDIYLKKMKFSHEKLFNRLWLTHFFYPNEYLRKEIENIPISNQLKDNYQEKLFKKYNLTDEEKKYQGHRFSIIETTRDKYYENKIEKLNIEKSMKYTFENENFDNKEIAIDKVLEIFDLSLPRNIFDDFLELNTNINNFVNVLNKEYGGMPSSSKLQLNQEQQDLLFAITKKTSVKKSDVSVILQYNIRKTFGMYEEVGLMKRYLFCLFDIIQSKNNITFDTKDTTMKGGAKENTTKINLNTTFNKKYNNKNFKSKTCDLKVNGNKVEGEILTYGKKLIGTETLSNNTYLLLQLKKNETTDYPLFLVHMPNYPAETDATIREKSDLSNKDLSSDVLLFTYNNRNSHLYVKGNKVYDKDPTASDSKKKFIKTAIPKEIKIAKSINKIKLLGILKSRNPLLFRRNNDENRPSNNQIKKAYQLLFKFFDKYLKKTNFEDMKGKNHLFYNNILSFLEFLVKLREVGALVFQTNTTGKLEIKKNVNLQTKINNLLEKKTGKSSIISIDDLFTTTQNTALEGVDIDGIKDLANAFAVKFILDFNKNYLNENDILDTKHKDRFLKNFLDFLKQFTPNLYTVRFYEEFAGKPEYLKLVISQKKKLLELLKTDFEETNENISNIEFDKINQIFMEIKFNNYGKIESIFGEKFSTSTYTATDILKKKSEIQEEIDNYIKNHLILQGIDFQRLNTLTDIKNNNNLTDIQHLLKNIKTLDSSFTIQDGGAKKKKEDERGFCYPIYGNCKLYPDEMHRALIPVGNKKKGATKTFKSTNYKTFFEETNDVFDEKTKIDNLKTPNFPDFYLNLIFDKIPKTKDEFENTIDKKINLIVPQEPDLKKFLRMIKDIKIYMFQFEKNIDVIQFLLYARANEEIFERQFKILREQNEGNIKQNVMMDELLSKVKSIEKNNLTLSQINHDFNLGKDVPAELNLMKMNNFSPYKKSIQNIFITKTEKYKSTKIIPANTGYKTLSTIPKIDNNGFYTYEQAFEFYIKIKYFKEKKPASGGESVDDCQEYEIKNLSREAKIDVNKNPIFEDFIFYQKTIFDKLRKNIKDELLKLNQESRNLVTNISTLTQYYVEDKYITPPDTLQKMKDSIIKYQEAEDMNEPAKFRTGERSGLKLEKIIDLSIKDINNEQGKTQAGNNFINTMTNSNIISNISKIEETISTEKKQSKYYIKFLGKKYWFTDLHNIENLKIFILNNEITFMDVVLLCQIIHKNDDNNSDKSENIEFTLLDMMIKSQEEFYNSLLIEKLYNYKIETTDLKDISSNILQNNHFVLQKGNSNENENIKVFYNYEQDFITFGHLLFMLSFINQDIFNKSKNNVELLEILEGIITKKLDVHEFVKIYNLRFNEKKDFHTKINITDFMNHIKKLFLETDIFEIEKMNEEMKDKTSITYTKFIELIKSQEDTPLFSLFDNLKQGNINELKNTIKKNIIDSILQNSINKFKLQRYTDNNPDLLIVQKNKHLHQDIFLLMQRRFKFLLELCKLYVDDAINNIILYIKKLVENKDEKYYDNVKINIDNILTEVLNPILNSILNSSVKSLNTDELLKDIPNMITSYTERCKNSLENLAKGTQIQCSMDEHYIPNDKGKLFIFCEQHKNLTSHEAYQLFAKNVISYNFLQKPHLNLKGGAHTPNIYTVEKYTELFNKLEPIYLSIKNIIDNFETYDKSIFKNLKTKTITKLKNNSTDGQKYNEIINFIDKYSKNFKDENILHENNTNINNIYEGLVSMDNNYLELSNKYRELSQKYKTLKKIQEDIDAHDFKGTIEDIKKTIITKIGTETKKKNETLMETYINTHNIDIEQLITDNIIDLIENIYKDKTKPEKPKVFSGFVYTNLLEAETPLFDIKDKPGKTKLEYEIFITLQFYKLIAGTNYDEYNIFITDIGRYNDLNYFDYDNDKDIDILKYHYDNFYETLSENIDVFKVKNKISKRLPIEDFTDNYKLKLKRKKTEEEEKNLQNINLTFLEKLKELLKKQFLPDDFSLNILDESEDNDSDSDSENDLKGGSYLEELLDGTTPNKTKKIYRKIKNRNLNDKTLKQLRHNKLMKGGSANNSKVKELIEDFIKLNIGFSVGQMNTQLNKDVQYTTELNSIISNNSYPTIKYDSKKGYLENIQKIYKQRITNLNEIKYFIFENNNKPDNDKYIFKMPKEAMPEEYPLYEQPVTPTEFSRDNNSETPLYDLASSSKANTDQTSAIKYFYIVRFFLKIPLEYKEGEGEGGKQLKIEDLKNKFSDNYNLKTDSDNIADKPTNILKYLDIDEKLKLLNLPYTLPLPK